MITRSPIKQTKSHSGPPARRAPTPLRSAPAATATTSILTSSTATGSTATPHEAMVASQLVHINDLVQKNRSLEQTIKKLDEDLSKSAADILAFNTERRSWEGDRNTWTRERQKWIEERKAWTEGCDTMQAFHRIQQYRVACALHNERIAVLRMQEAARNEQLKRLQRDYKIAMFQARETELEAQIDAFEELRAEAMETSGRHEQAAQGLKARCAALTDETKSKMTEIQAAQKRYNQLEDDLRRLREAHADATATSTAASSKLTRLTTERNSLEAQVTSLKRSLELSQDENTQLRTQLTNWQNLKKGEDADAEEARKRKAELEQELREAKRLISESETRASETDVLEAKVQKQKERINKSKTILEEWQTEVREQTAARETAETQLTDAQVQITSLEQKIVELQAQLSVASNPKPSAKKALPPPDPVESDKELSAVRSSPSTSVPPTKVKGKPNKPMPTSKPSSSRPVDLPTKPRSKPRLVKQPNPISELQDSDIEILDSPPVPLTVPERNTKAKGKQKAVSNDSGRSDIEVEEVQKPKKKGKPKNAEKEETKEATKNRVAKRKKMSPSEDEAHSKTKAKANPKKRSPPGSPKDITAKPSQPEGDAAAPKKKKRKINLFGASQPTTFDWDGLAQNGEGLGIPTRLSPMKETDVPRRFGRASKG